MDRRPRLAVIALAVAGCATAGSAAGGRVVERGTLGYAVAFGDGALCTVELGLRFELVVRDPATGAARARHDLGPAERDLPALAIADGAAWVGGADQQVRAVALTTGAVTATWPIGAPVTAVAATADGLLAVADAAGAVCLRRRVDGALLQCLALPRPARALIAAGAELLAVDERGATRLTVPALVARPTAAPAPTVRGHDAVLDGRVVARFAGPAGAVARAADGTIAALGWVRALGDPSVILVPPRRY